MSWPSGISNADIYNILRGKMFMFFRKISRLFMSMLTGVLMSVWAGVECVSVSVSVYDLLVVENDIWQPDLGAWYPQCCHTLIIVRVPR